MSRTCLVFLAIATASCGRVGFDRADAVSAGPDVTPGTELLVNGDFSADLAGWVVTRVANGTFGEPYPYVSVWDGLFALCIDSPGDADGYVEQTVTVPANATLELSLHTWSGYDPISVTLSYFDQSAVEQVIDRYDPPCKENRGCSTPEHRSYQIGGYAGSRVTLRLRNTSPFGNTTRAFFDDISLRPL